MYNSRSLNMNEREGRPKAGVIKKGTFFFFFKGWKKQEHVCLLAEEGIQREKLKVKSWFFSGSEIWLKSSGYSGRPNQN